MADEIKTLEYATERSIRAILRNAMRDIITIEDFDYSVSRIERVGYSKMHDAIAKVYLAGYNTAGRLIKKRFVTAAIDPFEDVHTIEDPLIAKHTTQMLDGVSTMAAARRLEVEAALSMYYEKGYTADRVARALETFFDDDPTAARRFARTATNDIYNRAHLDRYTDSGVVDGVQFSAHIDDRTSDICRVLDGTIWAVNSDEIKLPPRHFNCFIEGTRFEPTSDIVAAFRAWYDGQIVELTLPNGRTLSVTLNHMLLTPDGFLAAQLVRKGDNVICRPTLEGIVDGINPNNDNIHPTVEEVFSTFSISGSMCSKTYNAQTLFVWC
jgi:SPP1 gp7 family putative phage head morphogenesis protein